MEYYFDYEDLLSLYYSKYRIYAELAEYETKNKNNKDYKKLKEYLNIINETIEKEINKCPKIFYEVRNQIKLAIENTLYYDEQVSKEDRMAADAISSIIIDKYADLFGIYHVNRALIEEIFSTPILDSDEEEIDDEEDDEEIDNDSIIRGTNDGAITKITFKNPSEENHRSTYNKEYRYIEEDYIRTPYIVLNDIKNIPKIATLIKLQYYLLNNNLDIKTDQDEEVDSVEFENEKLYNIYYRDLFITTEDLLIIRLAQEINTLIKTTTNEQLKSIYINLKYIFLCCYDMLEIAYNLNDKSYNKLLKSKLAKLRALNKMGQNKMFKRTNEEFAANIEDEIIKQLDGIEYELEIYLNQKDPVTKESLYTIQKIYYQALIDTAQSIDLINNIKERLESNQDNEETKKFLKAIIRKK